MTDYSSWKVNDLKAELKNRGVSQTGLRLKQAFIDRLVEDDAKKSGEGVKTVDAGPAPGPPVEAEKPASDQHDQAVGGAEPQVQEHKPEVEQSTAETVAPAATDNIAEAEKVSQEKPPQAVDGDGDSQREQPDASKEDSREEQPIQSKPSAPEKSAEEPVEHAPKSETAPESTNKEQDTGEMEVDKAEATAEAKEEPAVVPVEAPESAPAPESTNAEQDVGEAKDNKTEKVEAEAPEQKIPPPDEQAAPTAPGQPTTSATESSSTSVPAEEITEDMRKRKRRSVTPVPAADEMAKKRIRSEQESPHVTLVEDNTTAENRTVPPAASNENLKETAPAKRPSITTETRERKPVSDARFRDLFKPRDPEPLRPASPSGDAVMKETEVEPALHPATTALFIDGLMRPLQPTTLRNHIISLASAPGEPVDAGVIPDFYLDPIKTHCFVSFTSVAAASRVRTALHGTVWPNERNRKSLFVDFIPEEKLREWIGVEEEVQRRDGRAGRWGVKYEPTSEGVEAILHEIDPKASAPRTAPREPAANRPPPTGPRASFAKRDSYNQQQTAPNFERFERYERPRQDQGFKALDDLFKSTTTKPKLYYQPVPRDVVDRRLDRFDDLIRRGSFPRRGGDEKRRITFEDTDLFVDNGAEFGNRGGGNIRGRGGRRRGGFGFGGGMRDSWRRDRY